MPNVLTLMFRASGSMKKRSKTVPLSRSLKRDRGAGKRPAAQTTEDLAVEFYSMVRLALGELGVSRRQQERALERSRHLKTPPNVSGRVLRAGCGSRGDIARMVAQSTIS